jgi:hypothetical protein
MAKLKKQLSKAPLAEVVFEVRWEAPLHTNSGALP